MSDIIPLSVPSIQGNEWKYIKECLDTEWVSSAGKYVDLFENKIAEYCGAKYAVACVNGTSALQISLILAGVKQGDEVIVPTLTFIAPVNVVRYLSANPVFMDCDDYYNIDPEKTCDFIRTETDFKDGYSYNKKTKNRVSAIIPVHVFGNAVNFDELYDLCIERNIKIIEDATESLGTVYTKGKFKGKHTGTIGELGCLSFNGNKIITTGGGGMILTDNEEYAQKARYLTTQAKDDELRYIHNEIGYNFRLTNIQAALGVAQLEQLPGFLKKKKENYLYYQDKIEKVIGIQLAGVPQYAGNNHWMFALQINEQVYSKNRDKLINHFLEHNIQTRPVWYLNHLQPPYIDYQNYNIHNAQNLYNITLNLPCSVNLQNIDINKVIDLLKE